MAWGSKSQIITAASVSTTETFSSKVSLNPREMAHCIVKADFPASPTDDLIVSVYTTLDASSETYDDVPLIQFAIDNGTDPSTVPLVVGPGIYAFRIGVVASGTTDTITVDAWQRVDGVSA